MPSEPMDYESNASKNEHIFNAQYKVLQNETDAFKNTVLQNISLHLEVFYTKSRFRKTINNVEWKQNLLTIFNNKFKFVISKNDVYVFEVYIHTETDNILSFSYEEHFEYTFFQNVSKILATLYYFKNESSMDITRLKNVLRRDCNMKFES